MKRAIQRTGGRAHTQPRNERGAGPVPPAHPRVGTFVSGVPGQAGPTPHLTRHRRLRPRVRAARPQGPRPQSEPKVSTRVFSYQLLSFWTQTVDFLALRGRRVGHRARLQVRLPTPPGGILRDRRALASAGERALSAAASRARRVHVHGHKRASARGSPFPRHRRAPRFPARARPWGRGAGGGGPPGRGGAPGGGGAARAPRAPRAPPRPPRRFPKGLAPPRWPRPRWPRPVRRAGSSRVSPRPRHGHALRHAPPALSR